MPVKIRLRRIGAKHQPFYRVVVADGRSPQGGLFIEEIGTYDPTREPAAVHIQAERAEAWLAKGAQPSETVKALLRKQGIGGGKTPVEGKIDQ